MLSSVVWHKDLSGPGRGFNNLGVELGLVRAATRMSSRSRPANSRPHGPSGLGGGATRKPAWIRLLRMGHPPRLGR